MSRASSFCEVGLHGGRHFEERNRFADYLRVVSSVRRAETISFQAIRRRQVSLIHFQLAQGRQFGLLRLARAFARSPGSEGDNLRERSFLKLRNKSFMQIAQSILIFQSRRRQRAITALGSVKRAALFRPYERIDDFREAGGIR